MHAFLLSKWSSIIIQKLVDNLARYRRKNNTPFKRTKYRMKKKMY
jgi:hypothetical protein